MRLIDADELKRAIEDRIDYVPSNDYDEGWNSAINTAIDEIDNAPTVEANSIIDGLNNEIDDLSENLAWYINERNRLLKERRPHGKWIIEHDWVHCFPCGHEQNYPSNFCPNCGADMRGNDNETN